MPLTKRIRLLLQQHGLFLLVLVVAGACYVDTLASHGMFMWDEAEYASMARSVSRGENFLVNGEPNALRPPLLPLAGAGALLLSGSHDDTVLKVTNLVFALLALGSLYWFVCRVHGRDVALAAAVFLGAAPAFWDYTSFFLSEIPFLAFFFTAIASFLVGLYEDERFFFICWTSVALAVLTRYTGVLLGPLLAAFALVAFLSGGPGVRGRLRTWSFFAAPLCGLILLLPWLLRQWLTFGDPLIGFKIASQQLQVYLPNVSMPWSFYLSRLPDMLSWVGCAFLMAGALSICLRRDRYGLYLLAVFVFLVTWFSVYRYKEVRLLTSMLPFAAAISALGLSAWVLRAVKDSAKLPVLIVCGLVIFGVSYRAHRAWFDQSLVLGYPSFASALMYIRDNTPPSAKVMATTIPQVSWYTERKARDFPERDQLVSRLRDVEWAVVTNFERGQQSYVFELPNLFTQQDVYDGRLLVFNSDRYTTVVIRAEELLSRLQQPALESGAWSGQTPSTPPSQ